MKGSNQQMPNAYAVDAQTAQQIPIEAVAVENVQLQNDNNNDSDGVNSEGARAYLAGHRWPRGLTEQVIKNLQKVPIRFFICDDSGSMAESDGHRLVSTGSAGQMKSISCTRWSELTESLKFHVGLSHSANALSEFRLLNGATIRIAENNSETNVNALNDIFSRSPSGGTPLCHHIKQVVQQIRQMEHQLRSNGQKACVIIMTDGESSDGDIASAMRPLKNLPVWVVVRLCTDEDRIVNYWNNIDSELELDMDVLDDLHGEAAEVTSKNSWLTYGEPLHRLREFGIPLKEIDLLDERKLSIDQMRVMCNIM